MSYRKYLKHLILGVLSLILLCIGTIVVIDPAFQYHMPFGNIKAVYSNERYQNSGMTKHFEYDSVIVGSSVTSNFRVSWFNELFDCKTLKLSYPGGCLSDFYTALSYAFEKNPNIERVFWSLDPKILMSYYNAESTPMPDYLYNDSVLDDAKYVLNKDVLVELCGESVLATITGQEYSIDEAFTWDSQYDFDSPQALWGYVRPEWSETVISADAYDDIVNENLDKITSIIESHPETEFYLFTPPYSILYWDRVTRDGTYPAVLKLFDRLVTDLTPYENVNYYCFAPELYILDLNNYIDEVHFSPQINRKIAEYMATHDGVDESSILYMHTFFKDIIENFDYESLFPVILREKPAKHRVLDSSY